MPVPQKFSFIVGRTGKMPVPQQFSFIVGRTGKMPVPQKFSFIVERASCPFLKIMKHRSSNQLLL
ncbi:hypothetical protein QUB28_18605 [Microcoleus sp. B4-C3]|uniref:hypothetical protein n=1 Tax=Microcoleus sp. B4-C2 TaxID=2818661 RepID=UPI002FCEEACE